MKKFLIFLAGFISGAVFCLLFSYFLRMEEIPLQVLRD